MDDLNVHIGIDVATEGSDSVTAVHCKKCDRTMMADAKDSLCVHAMRFVYGEDV